MKIDFGVEPWQWLFIHLAVVQLCLDPINSNALELLSSTQNNLSVELIQAMIFFLPRSDTIAFRATE